MNEPAPTRLPVPKPRRRKRDPLWDDEVEWLLRVAPRTLGERGTLSAVVASLQLGGAAGGVPNTDPYTDDQLRDVRRARRLLLRWHRLDGDSQGVLVAHYNRRPPLQQELSASERTARSGWPIGAERLGDCAAVALWLARATGQIDAVCRQCRGQRGALVALYRDRAEQAVRSAHAAWCRVATSEARAWVA